MNKSYKFITFSFSILTVLNAFGQSNSVALIKENNVKIVRTYSSPLKQNCLTKKKLISTFEYNIEGELTKETFYDKKGKVEIMHQYFYQSNGTIYSIIFINKTDTLIKTADIQSNEQVKIITGGIADYFAKVEFYESGLIKSETVILGNGKEALFEYLYEFY